MQPTLRVDHAGSVLKRLCARVEVSPVMKFHAVIFWVCYAVCRCDRVPRRHNPEDHDLNTSVWMFLTKRLSC